MKAHIEATVAAYTSRLSGLEGLAEKFSLIGTQEGADILGNESFAYILRTHQKYLSLVNDLANLSQDDFALVSKANYERQLAAIDSGSAVRTGADHFLTVLGNERSKLVEIAKMACTPDSEIFQDALGDLHRRMRAAEQIPHEELGDNTSAQADFAIWSWRMGLTPKALVHFFMYHVTERTIRAGFSEIGNCRIYDLIAPKDFLPLGDILALQIAQGKADSELAEIWSTSRKEGGVQWLSKEKQKIYNHIVASTTASAS